MLFHSRILIADLPLMNLLYLLLVVLLILHAIILGLCHIFWMHQGIFRIMYLSIWGLPFHLWSFFKEALFISLRAT